MRQRILEAMWIAGAWVIVAIAASDWRGVTPEFRPLYPATPVDGSNAIYAHQWRFLNNAKPLIPPGSSITFVSSDPDVDMKLFTLALGVMPDCLPLPWTYWLARQQGHSSQAEYVLAYLRDPPPEEDVVEIARFERQGLVLKRQ